jgi:V8-like Glu-specific endopeptidase
MRRRLALLVPALAALLLAAVPTAAITYGLPDGGLHPNVGALVDTSGADSAYCSGTLISPTVFLTAAHCGDSNETVFVTFEDEVREGVTTYAGTFYADPAYSQRQNDPHDIAVVVFVVDVAEAEGITPAELPALGQFDQLRVGAQFTAVGYGGTEAVNQPGGPVIGFPDERRYAVSSLNAVNRAWLRLSQNRATGDAGTCYGDSGGPNFLGAGTGETEIVAAITVTGDALCKATNVVYRLDTVSAQAFLCQFKVVDCPVAAARQAADDGHDRRGRGRD